MSMLPRHIAVIMDGNGRWAKNKGLSRNEGHKAGVEATRRIVEICAKRKIEVLTLFAFSSENWKRPKSEVSLLMELFLLSLKREINNLHRNNIKVKFIGERAGFNNSLLKQIINAENLTTNNSGLVLVIAANYGGRWDITQAVRVLVDKLQSQAHIAQNITDAAITEHLSMAQFPDPDLFIRTSGEKRISNFLMWQLAYTELYFTETLWPDFDEQELDKALESFAQRQRRFGQTQEQMG